MSALGAAKARLGIPAAASSPAGSTRSLLAAVAGRDSSASSAAASPSAADSSSTGGLQAEKALAIAFDHTAGRLLYLMQWAPPFQHQPSWVYASTLGGTDATVQAWIKKTGHTPVVFEKPFVGADASLDRGRPIPMQVVLQEVEVAADHQSGAGGLQDEADEEENGVLISCAGGAAAQAAARPASLRVDDSGPMDALRKAQQAAEAAAAAAQAVVTAAKQERVASAMRGLRQELASDDEGERDGSSYRGAGRASSSRGGKPGRGRR